ncbi:MAG TPA: dihydroorotate dehydrogenase electron transfer subunit [Dehalococcoidales bacterium]|nr:dihydroorotate dehydrogenase electron transfer subunit [Dehalococcoidales bacterium]
MKQVKAPIVSTVVVMPETYLVGLEAPQMAAAARPGQFIMVRCGGGTTLPRPFSVHRVDGGKVSLLFRVVGRGTRWLAARRKGETLDIFGPLGNGFTLPDTAQSILLAAGGIGIAPLVFLADEAVKQGKEIVLFMGAQNLTCILPHELLPAGVKTVLTTEDGSAGFQGIITAAWADMHLQYPAFQNIQDIFACGPYPMYQSMKELPHFTGKNVQVSLEIVMGCGAGVCYGCTIRTKQGLKQVCRDGPVFNLEDVIWEGPES